MAEAVGGGEAKAHSQYCYDVFWDKGDKIYVTGGEKANTFTVSDESAGTSKGKFTEDTPSYGIKGDIEAFYPASLHTEGGDYVWPAVQTNNQVPPMYAHQTISGTGDETVNFSSLGAMLQIVFNSTTPDITVTSVTIRDAAKPLSGKFTVNTGRQSSMTARRTRASPLIWGQELQWASLPNTITLQFLQATWHSSTGSYSWGFADKQTDIIGNAPGNTTIGSQENGSVVTLFGWSTPATYYGIATSTSRDEYPGDFID